MPPRSVYSASSFIWKAIRAIDEFANEPPNWREAFPLFRIGKKSARSAAE
jgi:hypothetical protein